jgi:hypothetical protein
VPPPFWRGWRGRRGCWLARLLQGIGGAATATLGFTSLIYAASEGPKNGWASLATLGTAGLGAVLLGLFVAAERRASAPLVPLPILCRRAVAVPNAAVVLKSMVGLALCVLPIFNSGFAHVQHGREGGRVPCSRSPRRPPTVSYVPRFSHRFRGIQPGGRSSTSQPPGFSRASTCHRPDVAPPR